MHLDPKGLERGAAVEAEWDGRDFSALGRADKQRYLDRLDAATTAYLSATAPSDVSGLVERLRNPMWSHNMTLPARLDTETTQADMTEAASTLTSLASDNAALTARVERAEAALAEKDKALEAAHRTMRNARGAIESGQIEDKQVRRQLTNGMEAIDAARQAGGASHG